MEYFFSVLRLLGSRQDLKGDGVRICLEKMREVKYFDMSITLGLELQHSTE